MSSGEEMYGDEEYINYVWNLLRAGIRHRIKKKYPLPLLLCLTDKEIRTLKLIPDSSLRWSLISELYNSKN